MMPQLMAAATTAVIPGPRDERRQQSHVHVVSRPSMSMAGCDVGSMVIRRNICIVGSSRAATMPAAPSRSCSITRYISAAAVAPMTAATSHAGIPNHAQGR